MTDDEAYYWQLSRKLDWGYAFHPPMVAWLIALFERPLAFLGGGYPGVVRLPAVLCYSSVFAFLFAWLPKTANPVKAALVLLSFVGFTVAGWMMVPDLSLFAGWMLAFWMSWRIVSSDHPRN